MAQVQKAHADLDERMSSIPKACQNECDACCYQMVSVHTWEEDLICRHIETSMHAETKKQVRKQMTDWWRHLLALLPHSPSRANPITLNQVQQLSLDMIRDRVKCPFLVDRKCSIYAVRPAMCRCHVVPDQPELCSSEPGRHGDIRGAQHLVATFGAVSPHLPRERYYHSMKPLAFAMTGVFKLPVPSTPMQGVALGDLLP